VGELVEVSFGLIRPDMLDLVSDAAAICEFDVARGPARLRSDVVGDSREEFVQLPAVLLVHRQLGITVERLWSRRELAVQRFSEFLDAEPPDVPHHQEHRVLHRRVIGRTEIPDPPCDEDVHEPTYEMELLVDDVLRLSRSYG